MVFEIKDRVGVDVINKREHELTQRAMSSWGDNENIEILGNPDAGSRVGIISFNLRSPGGSYLHHKFVTALLNDLFGIQSRAGCSCAGPYGHRLLNIDRETSERYRNVVQEGYCGMKPGWCRVGLHWVMDDAEANYVIDAVHFVAKHGERFLQLYDFDLCTGTWSHRQTTIELPKFSLDEALTKIEGEPAVLSLPLRKQLYDHYMTEANRWVKRLREEPAGKLESLEGELGELQFFSLPARPRH
jgi:hypothetical protein